MKEYMLIIRNDADSKVDFSEEQHKNFLKACESYIANLKQGSKLKSAQPLVREGKMITGSVGSFKEGPYNESAEILVGYYHIMAKDLDEAVSIAKQNPEFVFVKGAKIEVRPIKMKEQTTNYVYPN